jgi:NAD(P)-dependent dehydrogenase (short-subunit alcohol dehydrogenase family)
MSELRVLVTGAGSGIGRATSLLYARQGAAVALAGRRKDALDDVRAECLDAGAAQVVVVPTDVTDAEACERLVATAVDALGGLDVCVHAAAVAAYGRLEGIPLDAVDRVVETNVLGSLRMARPVLREFRERGSGTLVLLGSVLGRIAVPEMGAYVISKWAVRALTRTLALETRDVPGVHVCVIAPGGVDTPIYATAGNWTGRQPRAPWPVAGPDDVARVIARTVEHPRLERLTGWATPLIVAGAVVLPRLYDVLVGPLMRLGGFTGQQAQPGPGNLWRPDDGQ